MELKKKKNPKHAEKQILQQQHTTVGLKWDTTYCKNFK